MSTLPLAEAQRYSTSNLVMHSKYTMEYSIRDCHIYVYTVSVVLVSHNWVRELLIINLSRVLIEF